MVPEREREQSAVAGFLGPVWDHAAVDGAGSRDPHGPAGECHVRGRRRDGGARRVPCTSASGSSSTKGIRIPGRRGPESVGLYVTALIAAIPLDPHQPDDLPARWEFPEVEDCYSVAGEANCAEGPDEDQGDLEDRIVGSARKPR